MGHARVVLRPILMRFIPRFILVSYLDDVDDDDDDDDDDDHLQKNGRRLKIHPT